MLTFLSKSPLQLHASTYSTENWERKKYFDGIYSSLKETGISRPGIHKTDYLKPDRLSSIMGMDLLKSGKLWQIFSSSTMTTSGET